jgi:hypothetical protein
MISAQHLHTRDSLNTYDKSDRVSIFNLSPMQKTLQKRNAYKPTMSIFRKLYLVCFCIPHTIFSQKESE